MYTYGITGTSINEFGDVVITAVLDDQLLQYNATTGKWENVSASSVAGATSLDALNDVTAPTPVSGDFLKWNGSAWVNDAIDLGTDTTGNYVADVTAGTGISVTHTPGEGSSAAVALSASLDNLSDATVTSTLEWPGPFTNVTGGSGAPSNDLGSVGDFYVDAGTPGTLVLYGPKAASGTIWPNQGSTGAGTVASSITPPSGNFHNGASSGYYIQLNFTPPSTFTLNSVWGPYNAAGLGNETALSYDQTTRQFVASNGKYAEAARGGNWAAQTNTSASGTFILNSSTASCLNLTVTGNLTLTFSTPTLRPSITSGTRAARLLVTLTQGGSGGYTVTWPASIAWAGGAAPVASTRVGDIDVFELVTFDNGTNWTGIQLVSGSSRNNAQNVSDKTADYTFTRVDAGNIVTLSGSTNRDFTVPTNANVPLPVGTKITVATVDSGHIIVAGDSGVTVTGSTTLNTAGEIGTLIKVGTDSWIIHK
jgi:hypothetical protein